MANSQGCEYPVEYTSQMQRKTSSVTFSTGRNPSSLLTGKPSACPVQTSSSSDDTKFSGNSGFRNILPLIVWLNPCWAQRACVSISAAGICPRSECKDLAFEFLLLVERVVFRQVRKHTV